MTTLAPTHFSKTLQNESITAKNSSMKQLHEIYDHFRHTKVHCQRTVTVIFDLGDDDDDKEPVFTDDASTLKDETDYEDDYSLQLDDLDAHFDAMYADFSDFQGSYSGLDSVVQRQSSFTDFSFDETGSFSAPSTKINQALWPQLLGPNVLGDELEDDDDSSESLILLAESLAMGDASVAHNQLRRLTLARAPSGRLGTV